MSEALAFAEMPAWDEGLAFELSSVYRAPEVVQRTVAFPDPGCVADGPVQVIPRPLHGDAIVQPQRQIRRNRRREGAARSMRVTRVDPRTADLECLMRRAEHIHGISAFQMPSLDEYDARTHLSDPHGGDVHVLDRADGHAREHLGLGDVGCEHVRARE